MKFDIIYLCFLSYSLPQAPPEHETKTFSLMIENPWQGTGGVGGKV